VLREHTSSRKALLLYQWILAALYYWKGKIELSECSMLTVWLQVSVLIETLKFLQCTLLLQNVLPKQLMCVICRRPEDSSGGEDLISCAECSYTGKYADIKNINKFITFNCVL
jgi:hypothetical protein